MTRAADTRALAVWLLLGLGLLAGSPLGARAEEAGAASGAEAAAEEAVLKAEGDPQAEEAASLRERLTEREDRRRPLESPSIDLGGRPLTFSGEYELALGYLRRRTLGIPDDPHQPDQLLLEQHLELEAFYSFGEPLSIFVQGTLEMQEDLLANTFDEVSEIFVERGEMWLYSENIAGSGLNFDVGRLDFEDERRWWWDEELDAVRLEYEARTFDIAAALAYEVAPSRSDHPYVEPEQDGVLRVIGEASWEFSSDHALELFLLHQDDHSRTEAPGDVVRAEREDDSDARLTWLGARLVGAWDLPRVGVVGYWLDTGYVRGEERLLDYEDIPGNRSEVAERSRRDVRGWGIDLGVNWILPVALEPRLFAGWARGSGDRTPDAGSDRSFRQTALEGNEAGFGGVERFAHYGVLLDPELSNLQVLTLGAGISLLRSSSLDLVYHAHRLVEPATALRNARLEPELTGQHRDLGQELDLVLAIEEWERFEIELIGAAFRAGRAFGDAHGDWSYGGFFAMRLAF